MFGDRNPRESASADQNIYAIVLTNQSKMATVFTDDKQNESAPLYPTELDA